MSNRLPSREESENELTCVVISISALGLELGLGGGAPAWFDDAEELSCFFLPKRLPRLFIMTAEGLSREVLSEELVELDGGGFDGC